jgi:PAS domain S-box-containing protein
MPSVTPNAGVPGRTAAGPGGSPSVDPPARFHDLLEGLTDGYVRVAMDGRILETNEAYRRMLGYDDSELRAKTYRDLTPERWHAMEERIVEKQILRHHHSEVYEKEYRRKDGTLFPVELRTYLTLEDGRPTGMWALVRDITERKHTEEALAASEELFRVAFFGAPVGMALMDPEGRPLRLNLRLCEMLGFSEAELRVKNWRDVTHPDDVPATERAQEAAANLTVGSLEKRYLRKDGSVLWASVTTRAVRSPSGQIQHYVSTIVDITARKLSEEALSASERRHRALLKMSPAPILAHRNGFIEYANPAALRLVGASRPESIVGRSVLDFVPPELRDVLRERLALLAEGRAVDPVELEVIRADGTKRVVTSSSAAFDDGQGRAIQTVFTDITELKRTEERLRQSEQRYRDLIERLPDASILERDGRIESANLAAGRLFGADRIERILGRATADLMLPTGAWAPQGQVDSGLAGEAVQRTEVRIRGLDGVERVAEAARALVDDERGKAFHVLLHDVTAAREMEARLQASLRLAALGTLVAGVAHEVNNPLAALLMSLECVGEDLGRLGASQGTGELLARARAEAEQIASIVKELNVVGRPGAPRSRVGLAAAVDLAISWLGPSVGEKVDLRVEVAADQEVVASEGQLAQVFANLVANAVKSIPAGRGGRVLVRLGPGSPGMARIDVDDDGEGMPPEILAHMFEPFFSTRRVGEGPGLGLWVSHAIVTTHGGTITATSEVGKGSTFRVELPAAPPVG